MTPRTILSTNMKAFGIMVCLLQPWLCRPNYVILLSKTSILPSEASDECNRRVNTSRYFNIKRDELQQCLNMNTIRNNPIWIGNSNGALDLILRCDFNPNESCGLQDTGTGKHKWIISDASHVDAPTGPTELYDGHYAYMEASGVKYKMKFTLQSNKLPDNATLCLRFAYFMHVHDNTSELSVWLHHPLSKEELCRERGNYGKKWIYMPLNFKTKTDAQIKIVATRGSDYRGDIAIDSVEIYQKGCAEVQNVSHKSFKSNCVYADMKNKDVTFRDGSCNETFTTFVCQTQNSESKCNNNYGMMKNKTEYYIREIESIKTDANNITYSEWVLYSMLLSIIVGVVCIVTVLIAIIIKNRKCASAQISGRTHTVQP